jgi:predicted esterase
LAQAVEAVEARVLLAGFTGVYFNNADLTSPVLTRTDAAIDFDWGTGSPAAEVGPSTFSARWTGFIQPTFAETYTFFTRADDGVRLRVNGQTLIDRWQTVPKLQGDANGDGRVDFSDFQWLERQSGTAGPEADFNADGTVDKFDLKILLANQGKTLAAGGGSVSDSATLALEAGKTYTLEFEYFQNAKSANVKLEWQSTRADGTPGQPRGPVAPAEPPTTLPPDPTDPDPDPDPIPGPPVVVGTGNGLLGTYFDNIDFTGNSVSRIDPRVQFDWAGHRPHSRIDTSTFSVRWEGQILAPATGDYWFYTATDDGARMWVKEAPFDVDVEGRIEDAAILDYWGDQTGEEYRSHRLVRMEAGKRYNVRLEYYQNEGGAMAELRWEAPGVIGKSIVPTSQLFPSTNPTQTEPPPTSPPVQSTGTLRVSPTDPHFLVRADGSPFFYLADTAWSLFNKTTRAEADFYLQTRADQEFTVTQAVLFNQGVARGNAAGAPIFINNNPATPNPEYFEHVDYVLEEARGHGMYVAMLPTWGDAVAATDGRRVFNTANAYAYGQWLGNRYRNQPNILWVLGGDWAATDPAVKATWRAMAEGLRAGDGGAHLITFHPPGANKSSTDYFTNSAESWLAFNTVQSGHGRDSANYTAVNEDWGKGLPVIDAEPNYENIPNNLQLGQPQLDDYDVRKKTYWALFAGAFGAAYGNIEVYQFYNGNADWLNHWTEAMQYPGANQMKFAKRLMQSRPYLGRVPDQGMIVGANPGGTNHVQATRASNGSYAFVYAAGGLDVTVDLSRISGQTAKAYWYNPRNGSSEVIGDFATEGQQTFSPPTSGYGNDWVLVLDDASRGYPEPGKVALGTDPTGSTGDTVTDDSGTSIRYRLFEPTGVAAGQKVPLVLYLHGKGERGTDNVKQTTWLGGLVDKTKSGQYAAYVLAPQIDTSSWYQSYNSEPTAAMRLVIQTLKNVIATENVDPSRVYVTGVSMGGMGAWDILRWEPDLFAAAVPMSGGAAASTADAIKHVPVWAFHGSADDIVPVGATRTIVQALRDAGASPRYTEIPGAKHAIWDPIYRDSSNQLYGWLFAQQKAVAVAVPGPVPVPGGSVSAPAAPGISPVVKPAPTKPTPTKSAKPAVARPTSPPVFSVKPVKTDKAKAAKPTSSLFLATQPVKPKPTATAVKTSK